MSNEELEDLSGFTFTYDYTYTYNEDDGTRRRIENLDLSGNSRTISTQLSFDELFSQSRTKSMGETMISFYLQGMLSLLRLFNFTYAAVQSFVSISRKVSGAIQESLNDEVYVFFEGSTFPYRLNSLQLDHPGSPHIEWYYNATKQTFISSRLYSSSQSYHTKHIPYLSTEVKYNALTLYDISEFVNSIRWAGEEGKNMPSATHLLSGWTLSSGIVLNTSNDMMLFVTDTDGEDQIVPLRNDT